MITIYSGFASVNSISLRCCASLSLFLNFYLYINPLKKMLPYRRWANAREFYYRIIVASHANTHNSYTIWLSSYLFFCLSLLLQGYLSLPLTHTHYNSLLNSSILITVLSSESIMSACVVKFRAHPTASFSLLSSAIPHIRLLVQKLRQSLFPFTLFFVFFFFSITLSPYRYCC